MWSFNFRPKQFIVDVIKIAAACLIAYWGHPYIGIILAVAIHIEFQ